MLSRKIVKKIINMVSQADFLASCHQTLHQEVWVGIGFISVTFIRNYPKLVLGIKPIMYVFVQLWINRKKKY